MSKIVEILHVSSLTMVNVIKFQTLVTCKRGHDKQRRPHQTASKEAA